ncbi:helix-turn-helix domain-containing protein [Bifidobacterium sp. ESL0690]|uniref:helix-turn-helix transcriptional regulator n=1 Tax=Bifidobacterium sp. ESL0690 TaxID=2983214 RepID=UPI0023F98B96|nr:helix-turn-helix domain-containing protein [Bifidobacterium sp. ESL0690]WEV47020.1 helix-turn-helix domain-containing protein [Bifidobacterium sp. ESL0690]
MSFVKLLTEEQVLGILHCSKSTLRRLRKAGDISGIKPGSKVNSPVVYDPREIDAYLRSCRE